MTTDTLRPATGAISEAEIEAVAAELAFKSYLRTGMRMGRPATLDMPAHWKALFSELRLGWRADARSLLTTAASVRPSLPSPKPEATRWHHVKRGAVYEVIGMAQLQVSTSEPVEGSGLVIYRGEDGKLWAREWGEFQDGRFVRLDPTTPQPGSAK